MSNPEVEKQLNTEQNPTADGVPQQAAEQIGEQADAPEVNTEELTPEQQIEQLTLQLADAQKLAESHREASLRSKAETENIRRRTEREVTNASKFALEKFAKEILGVVDSLERALEHPAEDEGQKAMHEGIELTYKLLTDTLKKFSIEQISPLGEDFDPALHEAMVMQESDEHDANSVMQVIQQGYQLSGRLIRPARVIVAKGKPTDIDQKA